MAARDTPSVIRRWEPERMPDLTHPFSAFTPLAGDALTAAHQHLDAAASVARASDCHRGSCGAVIISADQGTIGIGANGFPGGCGLEVCRKDVGFPAGFKSDKTCCQHAEVRAVFSALANHPDQVSGSTLYFTRVNDRGERKVSGSPYCTICSKACLDVGIARFVLEQEHGVVAYPTDAYNDLSFMYDGT